MASAGSFVHGSSAGEEGSRKKSKEEQDIADFLSSIDDMTSVTSGGEVNLHGGRSSGSGGGDVFLGSITPPTQQQQQQQDMNGDASDLSAIADAFPADWLQGMEGLEIVGGPSDLSAPRQQAEQPQQPPPTPPPHDAQRNQQQGDPQQPRPAVEEHSSDREPEILGEEPEILDDVEGGYDSGAAAAGRLMSASERVASWATSTPASLVGVATAAFRGDARNTAGFPSATTAADAATRAGAEEPPLDWPGTLDMLGMTEAQAEYNGNPTAAAAAAAVPASELPSMPSPAAREQTFPDFVEIRDPRNVSQFPKPDNALVAKVAAGWRNGGDGQAWDEEGDGSGGGTVAGQGVGKEQGQGQGQRQVLPAPLRTVEVYLRPDVTWESVSDVYMAVMLSRGLVVRQQTEKTVTAEKSADAPGDWSTVKLTVGVTRDKLRTLVIQFYADSRAPMLSFAGTMARFSGRAGDELYTALRDALVERRMPLSFLATDAEEVSLDPHYVRALVGMYAHENIVNLTRYALPLEEFVRQEEERSARLAATLLPQYQANGLEPPRPTRSKPLSAYPLTTKRPPVASCGVEEAREVIERAREHAHAAGTAGSTVRKITDEEKHENVFAASGGADGEGDDSSGGGGAAAGCGPGSGPGSMVVAEGIRSLIRATWEDVKDWCDEEAEARVRRKDAQVRDRLLAVERHREALVAALRDGAGGSGASGTPVGREFAARFRLMAEEAVLCYCKAVHAKRVGQLYLTCNHLCFHSSVLGFTSQRVLPLLTVASVSHAPSVLGMDLVTLVDRGGEEHSFGITAVEAGFPQRFRDLLNQCLVLCKADASRRAAEREGAAATDKEPDEEQILARVQRLAKAKQLREAREAAAAAAPPVQPVLSPAAGAGIDKEGALGLMGGVSGGGEGIVEGGAGGAVGMGDDAAGRRNEGGRVGPRERGGGAGCGGGAKPGSMMAMGIQAFLEESQKR
eukprot:g20083.t1